MSIRPNVQILTDYFSLIPLLRRSSSYPLTIPVLDPKKINPTFSKAPVETLLITPKKETVTYVNKRAYIAKRYSLKWGKSRLEIWMSKKYNMILKIKYGKTLISLVNNKTIHDLLQIKQTKFFKQRRKLPYALNTKYSYGFYFQSKKIGNLHFSIRKASKKRFQVFANGTFKGIKKKPKKIRSETIYDENFRPIFYECTDTNSHIICKFVLQGVKEKLQQKKNVLERFVPLSQKFMFLDNNAIHLFAMFVSQLPFKKGTSFNIEIFHPRRLQATEGKIWVVKKTKRHCYIALRTQFYTIKLVVDLKGKLVRYYQGKLAIFLE